MSLLPSAPRRPSTPLAARHHRTIDLPPQRTPASPSFVSRTLRRGRFHPARVIPASETSLKGPGKRLLSLARRISCFHTPSFLPSPSMTNVQEPCKRRFSCRLSSLLPLLPCHSQARTTALCYMIIESFFCIETNLQGPGRAGCHL